MQNVYSTVLNSSQCNTYNDILTVAKIKDQMWEQLECVSDYGLSADDSDVLSRRQSARLVFYTALADPEWDGVWGL